MTASPLLARGQLLSLGRLERLLALLLALVCISQSSWSAAAQDPDDEPPEFLPGLIGEVALPSGDRLWRLDDDLHFDGNYSSLDARVDPKSSFKARWSGFLECKEHGEFRLHAFAAGTIRVRVDEVEVLSGNAGRASWFDSKPVALKFGRHAIEVIYETADIQMTAGSRQLAMYWSGPQFELEPISHRSFSHRASDLNTSALTAGDLRASELAAGTKAATLFDRGSELSRALRCGACHVGNDPREPLQGPSLTHLEGNLHRDWLLERLTSNASEPSVPFEESKRSQRMPHFGLSPQDADAVVVALFDASQPAAKPQPYVKPKPPKLKKDEAPPRLEPSVAEGRTACLSLGCLACHQLDQLGERSLFDGGDLSSLSSKRTAEFHVRWLENPGSVNADHRMPIFDLTPLQRADLALFLNSLTKSEQGSTKLGRKALDQPKSAVLEQGKLLIAKHRCGACHTLPQPLQSEPKRIALVATSDWAHGCLGASDAKRALPGFQLPAEDCIALELFWLNANRDSLAKLSGHRILVEQNCVKCHARDAASGLANTLARLAKDEPEIAPRLATLAPPSLTGVGDKLHNVALKEQLAGSVISRRPWLAVQMPKFKLTEAESKSLIDHLVTHDRIPEKQAVAPELPGGKATELAAARLVTAEGFGCQSCHKIGSTEPPKVAINAHGTDLTMLGDRIRPSWFRRWVRNPARIVPRMEMPAIQVAVKGVLHDDLNMQLEALWKTLNTPGFEPPKPNPVRVVRNFNVTGMHEHANVLTDVLETPRGKFLRPMIVGLPNRHNVLFDLESGRIGGWWMGDTARQYTRGKSWYWEAGAPPLVENLEFLQAFFIVDSSQREWRPATLGQFVVQFDSLTHIERGIEWSGRIELQHESESRFVKFTQRVSAAGESGLEVTTRLEDLKNIDSQVTVLIATPNSRQSAVQPFEPSVDKDSFMTVLSEHASATWTSATPLQPAQPHLLCMNDLDGSKPCEWTIQLVTNLPPDRFQPLNIAAAVSPAIKLDIVPGYSAVQLPLPRDEMPTALAWNDRSEMFIASLKGRVLQVEDTNADGLGDRMVVISDDLPAPYGLAANADSVDVLCKTSLIRLTPQKTKTAPGTPYNQQVVADGWGYTADYHDWAVGLERSPDGSYIMALPCQQDDRSPAAAQLRGQALKLIPYQSADSPRAYRIESMSAGLRFPMGLALNRDGDLFATDNQGNYNPFNELNHLQFGKRYGFINKLETQPGFSPDFESPAVNLPHPWTRSVNGLCFLETPPAIADGGKRAFGSFEGDLIGCEYNGLSLIRMSLQKVNGQYQGAAYMFSRPPAPGEATFEGPVCCAVSPRGELFVGSIHDSGWGGGQNTGSIVRLQADQELPLGIDEVRATSTGFEIAFTQSFDTIRASQLKNYQIRSYRRISTPAYGGDDQDSRTEPVRSLEISKDRKTVNLKLATLREGFVYEINIAAIGKDDSSIFPSQAHYHMRAVPEDN